MAKKFLGVHVADKRAIDLHHRLKAAEAMPLIAIGFSTNGREILLYDRNDYLMYRSFTVDQFLRLDLQQAKERGGSYIAVMDSLKRRVTQVPQREVDEGVHRFLLGEEDR